MQLLMINLACEQILEVVVETCVNLILSCQRIPKLICKEKNPVSSRPLKDGLLKEVCVSIPLSNPTLFVSLLMKFRLSVQDHLMLLD